MIRLFLAVLLLETAFNHIAHAAVKDAAWLQGSSLEDGSVALVSATPAAIKWTETSSIDPTAFEHLFSDPAKLKLKKDGDYLVAATLPVTSLVDSDARPSQAIEVYVNGQPAPGTLGQSAYIRNLPNNANRHTESSDHIHALLTGLKAGDVIELRVHKTASVPIPSGIQSASLYVERVDAARPVFAGLSSGPTSGSNLNPDVLSGEAPAKLGWSSTRKDAGFTHTEGSETIRLGAGTYVVFVNIPLTSTVQRASPGLEVMLDGATVLGGRARQGYIRSASGHNEASLHWAGLVEVTGTQALTFQTSQLAVSGDVTIPNGKQASVYIEKLGGTAGVMFASATAVDNDANPDQWNPANRTALVWTTPTSMDTAVYAHNGTQLQVKQPGSYLLVYNDQLQATAARPNPRITVEINGVPVRGAETKTHYIRNTGGHNHSSAALVFLLDSLEANDVITVSTQREGNTGLVTIDEFGMTGAILALIKKETFVLPPGDSTPPRVTYFAGDVFGFEVRIDDFGRGLALDSVKVRVNGESVPASVTRTKGITTLTHSFGDPPPTGSRQSVQVTFSDAATPPGTHQVELDYVITDRYTRIPADWSAVGVDTSQAGFTANITQISEAQTFGPTHVHGNTIAGAERQLRGEAIDAATGTRYINEAGPDNATSWVIVPVTVEKINFEQTGVAAGNLPDDTLIPRIPGWGTSDNGIVGEFLGYIELKKGFQTLGVNSDDGFELRIGPSLQDQFARVAGSFNSGRGAGDTLIDLFVEEDGIYPVRLLWFEGGGGASVEFFSVVDGEKILINDLSNPKALKAYRAAQARPYISAASLQDGFRGVVKRIDLEITDADLAVVDGSVKLLLNGQQVAAQVTKQGKVTSVAFDNGGPLAAGTHTATLTYAESATPEKTRTIKLSFFVPPGLVAALEDRPVRYFRFAETSGSTVASDVTLLDDPSLAARGNVQNGAALDVPGLVSNGHDRSAIRFDAAASQRVIVPNGDDLNQNAGPWAKKSVEVWFKAEKLPRILPDGSVEAFGIYEQGGGDRAIILYLYGTQNTENPTEADLVWFAFNRLNAANPGGAWGAPENAAAGIGPVTMVSTPIKANEVYHAVGVMDGDPTQDEAGQSNLDGKLILYVNGEPKGSVTGVGQIYNHTGDVQIGRGNARLHDDFNGNLGFFTGVIDELILYNTALPAERIKAHYDQFIAAPPPVQGAASIAAWEVVGNKLRITWQGSAILTSPDVTGPYTAVAGAVPGTTEFEIQAQGTLFIKVQ